MEINSPIAVLTCQVILKRALLNRKYVIRLLVPKITVVSITPKLLASCALHWMETHKSTISALFDAASSNIRRDSILGHTK